MGRISLVKANAPGQKRISEKSIKPTSPTLTQPDQRHDVGLICRIEKIDGEPVLVVRYQRDLNLFTIDRLIRKHIDETCRYRAQELQSKLSIWERKTFRTRREHKLLTSQLEEIERREPALFYHEKAEPLLKAYSRLGVFDEVIDLKGSQKESDDVVNRRRMIIDDFLVLVSRFIIVRDLSPVDKKEKSNQCPHCGGQIVEPVFNGGSRYCEQCLAIFLTFCSDVGCSSDEPSISMSSGYEDRVNFHRGFLAFQGEPVNGVPSNLEEELDRYFRAYHYPTGEEIRRILPDGRGQKPGTSREMLLRALYETGHSDQYNNVKYICAKYWGWIMPNLMHLEDEIMRRYDLTEDVYKRLDRERKSSINTQRRLLFHLADLGYNGFYDEFKTIGWSDSSDEQEAMLKLMAEGAGLTYFPIP